jgi:drug/metabolite transporter (DMT)-like permease
MNIIQKLPGPFLVFLGAFFLSFGGLIVKSFEGATLWQILFWRQLFFVVLVSIFLLLTYKKKVFIALYESGLPGFFGGIILGCGFSAYVFAMYKTTVANANFIIQTQAIFLAIFGYLFLKEKITKLTLVSIIFAIIGIILMVGNSLSPGQLSGNLVAFIMPSSFAVLIIIVRKYPNVDMLPLQLFAGIVAMLIGYFVSTKISISINDIFLAFIAGFFQVGLGFVFITIGAKKTLSATVGILMMTEAVLGPIWAWMFLEEIPQFIELIGGSIIIIAVLIQILALLEKAKKKVK